MPGTLTIEISGTDTPKDSFVKRFSFSAGKSIQLPILGLFPDCDNRVNITLFDEQGTQRGTHAATIRTAPLPADFPVVTANGTYRGDAFTFVTYYRTRVRTDDDAVPEDVPEFLERAVPEITGIMYDKAGRVRWYSSFPYKFLFPLEFIDGYIYGGDWVQQTGVLRWYDLMGRQIGSLDFGALGFTRVHHDVIKKPDGHLVITVDKTGSDYIEDHVIEVDPASGKLVRAWDLNSVMPDVADLYRDIPMTSPQFPGFTNDPIHVNGIAYDPTDNGLIVSAQRSGVIKLHSNGTLAWFLAPHLTRYIDDADGDGVSDSLAKNYHPGIRFTWIGNYTGSGYVNERMPTGGKPTEAYPFDFSYGEFLLRPLDHNGNAITDKNVLLGFADAPDFRWPFRSHAPRLTKDGNLMLFDNGLARNFHMIGRDSFSRVVKFKVVPDTDGYGGTVRQTAEYLLRGDPSWYRFSALVSEADELPDGTLLITLGGLGSALYPPLIMAQYGKGPRGAYISQIDTATGDELHSLLIERVINEDYPNAPFTVYRSQRIDPYEALSLPKGLTRLTLDSK